MGLPRGAMQLLLDECRREVFSGHVATLGRQHIYFGIDELRQCAAARDLTLSDVDVRLHREPKLAESGFISDETFFRAIGFSEVTSIDFSNYEESNVIVDLNREIPTELHSQFDLIVDGGTLEHVFHLPQVLNNLYLMLRLGGRVIHLSPASNFLDHGFYCFSPTLFWDFYSINEYEIQTAKLIRIEGQPPKDHWSISIYEPGILDSISAGGLDDARYMNFVVAKKLSRSTGDRIPQQGYYLNTWNRKEEVAVIPRGDLILTRTAGLPIIHNLAKFAVGKYRSNRRIIESIKRLFTRPRRGLPTKVVARY